jgi:hypothetical protein
MRVNVHATRHRRMTRLLNSVCRAPEPEPATSSPSVAENLTARSVHAYGVDSPTVRLVDASDSAG